MNYSVLSWENHLIALATEALNHHNHQIDEDRGYRSNLKLLEESYRYCERITREHSKTFHLASALLPDAKREAIRALYAFCRVSDDLVDRSITDAQKKIQRWRDITLFSKDYYEDAIALAWNDTQTRFGIPRRYAEQLIDGVSQDFSQTRYQTFDELAVYCYGVACTVGLMSMHIIGYKSREAITYAIRLGVALQLTNILRDIGEDWLNGRLYLPQEELAQFDLNESDIERGNVTSKWRAFMRYQIHRNRTLYQEALPGINLLDSDGRFAIRAAAELYQAILSSIEANEYDVFSQRASVSKLGKIRRLPGIWWRVKQYPD